MVPKTKKIWMDGKFVDWDDARVHVLAHTLHYGVGVFEGIRCYKTDEGGRDRHSSESKALRKLPNYLAANPESTD